MVLYRFPVSDGKDLLHVTLFNNKFAAAKVRPGEEPVSYTHLDVYKRQVFDGAVAA